MLTHPTPMPSARAASQRFSTAQQALARRRIHLDVRSEMANVAPPCNRLVHRLPRLLGEGGDRFGFEKRRRLAHAPRVSWEVAHAAREEALRDEVAERPRGAVKSCLL